MDKETTANERQLPRRAGAAKLPSAEELMNKMLQIPGAVFTGALSHRDAALILKAYQIVLNAQLRRAGENPAAAPAEGLLEICRRDPSALGAVAPFLTAEQLQAIMSELGREG